MLSPAMTDEPKRKPAWLLAGAAAIVAVALALLFARGGERPPAPAAPGLTHADEAKPSEPAAPREHAPVAPVAVPGGVEPAGSLDEGAVARSMPPPDAIDAEAQNPAIEPELPKTPEWRLDKTRTILRAVEKRAERVQGEIATLDAEGKRAEAEEKRVLLGRLRKQVTKMQADIAGYAEQIAAGRANEPEEAHVHEGASP